MSKIWLGLALFLVLMGSAQAVLMTLEKPRIQAGEAFTLLVETRSSQAAEPSLEWPRSWEAHLQLVDRVHQVEPAARGDYQHRWLLTWQHQDARTTQPQLNLPPLRVNGRPAQPLRLNITPAPQPRHLAASRPSQPVEMTHHLERQEVYIGESLLYELTIRYQGYPREPRLSPLEIEGGYARSLGDGREQGLNQRGVAWQEARWRELVHINQPEAEVQPRYFSSRFDRPGVSSGERYSAEAAALPLKVLPQPELWPEGAPWLPALGIRLEAEWQGVRQRGLQGEPLTLEVNLLAVGQQARSLPRFKPDPLPGLRIEPLAEETRDQVVDGYLTSRLTQRFLLYPLEAGPLLLPPLQVWWWDTAARRLQQEEAQLPPLQITAQGPASGVQGEPLSASVEGRSPPNWGRLLIWLLAGCLLLFAAWVAWRVYRLQPAQQLKQRIQQGPDTWSHSDLIALTQAFACQEAAQPLLIQAASGQALSKKQLLAFWFGAHQSSVRIDLPPLNPRPDKPSRAP